MEFVFFGEVFIDELEENFCNIGLDIFAVWRVEPYYLSFPISFPRCALSSFVYKISSLYPLDFSASWYYGSALLKISSFCDKSDIRSPIDGGRSLMIVGAWLDLVLMYMGVLFGFLKG